MDYQWLIDWVDNQIVTRPRTIILLFLAATAVFMTGLGTIQTESGQGQFIDDLPSAEALEEVQRDFGSSFSEETTSSTLIQRSQNVLAKPSLLDMLRTQKRIADIDPLRVSSTTSPARTVAENLDPDADTLDRQILAVEGATPTQIDRAIRRAADRDSTFEADLSTDLNLQAASASAAEASVTHRAGPGAGGDGGGPGGGTEFPENKEEHIEFVISTTSSDIEVVGSTPDTIGATIVLVLPAALLFIILFLSVAYRDPIDLLIGVIAIVLTLIWTFGFLGLTGIPFAILLVAVPPLLLAIGIDFGIHAVNRYREERVEGRSITESMRLTTDQVTVAFFIVTGTSAIGFLSNLVSVFPPTRDFGIVAAAGVVFTFLLFGIFVPAAKVYVDRLREKYPVPTFVDTPLGSESSPLGRLLSAGVVVANRAPVLFLVVVILASAGGGVYASGVDSGFSPDDFLPSEETPDELQVLPEPFRPPAEFEYVKLDNFRDRAFAQTGQVQMLVRGPMMRDSALEELHRASQDPPPSFERNGREAEAQSIITVIQSQAQRNPEFRRLVERNDLNGNGIPDDNLREVYDALGETPAGDRLDRFLSTDRRSALIFYAVDGDAADDVVTADARTVASKFRSEAQPTGNAIIFNEAFELVSETVIQTLILTLFGATIFLVVIYWILEGKPSLGIANMLPIGLTLIALVASMRALGVKFNAINGTILAIAIGLGIDYSVHIVHRFIDEFHERALLEALERTVVGTGGALTGSMLTTVFGVGVLALALNPTVGVFGLLIGLSVFYAYLTSIFVLPSILVLWTRWDDYTLPLVEEHT